jgi:aspartate/tyrosine/aromatic aminotransferase
MSFFKRVPLAPPDPILGLVAAFQSDLRKDKVNLGVGVYKTEELQTPVLESVKLAEAFLLKTQENKEYLPIDGDKGYLEQMGALVFGEQLWSREKERIASFQTVGGTGALKIGGTFLKEEVESSVWVSTPTWPNHRGVFSHCGLKVEEYPYYSTKSHTIVFDQMVQSLEKLPAGAILLLHPSCHNPTGCDLSLEEWKEVCQLCKQKKLLPFFDLAYQGFGTGLDEDVAAIRLFLENGLEMLVAVSNAKNFSLYAERVGGLFIVSDSGATSEKITSRVKQMIRVNYSNPPMHGAKIIAHILGTTSLRKQWETELDQMRERIVGMRQLLSKSLQKKTTPIDFSQIDKGKGMFTFTGLNPSQVDRMREEYGIYMPRDGRINVCGLDHNLGLVVDAIATVAQGGK